MRFVLARPWRAFPELDGVPDWECRRMFSDVKRRHAAHMSGVSAVAVLYIFVGTVTWVALIPACFPILGLMPGWMATLAVLASIIPIAVPAQWLHDRALQRLIRAEIDHTRCHSCGYPLAGLPAPHGRARCPECGAEEVVGFVLCPDAEGPAGG